MEWIGYVFSTVINAGWRIYLAAFLMSAALIFVTDSFASQLGLEEIRHSYRTYAGIVLVASASLRSMGFLASFI
jgi:hypothetical protein